MPASACSAFVAALAASSRASSRRCRLRSSTPRPRSSPSMCERRSVCSSTRARSASASARFATPSLAQHSLELATLATMPIVDVEPGRVPMRGGASRQCHHEPVPTTAHGQPEGLHQRPEGQHDQQGADEHGQATPSRSATTPATTTRTVARASQRAGCGGTASADPSAPTPRTASAASSSASSSESSKRYASARATALRSDPRGMVGSASRAMLVRLGHQRGGLAQALVAPLRCCVLGHEGFCARGIGQVGLLARQLRVQREASRAGLGQRRPVRLQLPEGRLTARGLGRQLLESRGAWPSAPRVLETLGAIALDGRVQLLLGLRRAAVGAADASCSRSRWPARRSGRGLELGMAHAGRGPEEASLGMPVRSATRAWMRRGVAFDLVALDELGLRLAAGEALDQASARDRPPPARGPRREPPSLPGAAAS